MTQPTDSQDTPFQQPTSQQPHSPPSRRQILLGTVAAILIAGTVLVIAVLPAEFGIDPLGVGRVLGLQELADASDGPLEPQTIVHRADSVEFVLGPFQSLEYKYRLSEGNSMVYSWQATGELAYDMHADPDNMEGEEFVESFDKGDGASSMGTYHAPFTGIHGWFWENRTFEEVVLRLHSAGFYEGTILFRDGGVFEQTLDPVLN
ncbi:MAG: hypothetical protein V4751_12015 [Pseudomonadota bacterium]